MSVGSLQSPTITEVKAPTRARWSAAVYVGTLAGTAIGLAAAFLAGLLWVGASTGATLLPRTLAAAQVGHPGLIALPAEIRHWAAFKLPRIAEQRPEVVLIGSSRGNEIRSVSFRPYSMYNASLTCWSMDQMLAMAEHVIKVHHPRVLMLSLDYFMFTDAYAASVNGPRTMYFNNDWTIRWQSAVNLLKSVAKYPSLWIDRFPPYLVGDVPIRADGHTFLGLDAIRAEAGFRYDGSFLYEEGTLLTSDRQTAANRGLLDAMPGGLAIAAAQWAPLDRLAAFGRENGVSIVAVQWPILKASTDFLDHDAGYRPFAGIWREFRSAAMTERLKQIGITFFDLSALPTNEDARNFIDAAHANEAGMLNAMIALEQDERFRAVFPDIDLPGLQATREAALKAANFTNIYKERF